MDPFIRLEGSQKFPPGREWVVLKKLPYVFLLGTAVLLGLFIFAENGVFGLNMKEAMLFRYAVLGALLLHWMSILGVALFCAIVCIMKGPAYVRDPYYLPEPARYDAENE
jgi:hypothetical protein